MNLEYFFLCHFKSLHLIFCQVLYKTEEVFILWEEKSFLESNLVPFISQELCSMVRPVLLH